MEETKDLPIEGDSNHRGSRGQRGNHTARGGKRTHYNDQYTKKPRRGNRGGHGSGGKGYEQTYDQNDAQYNRGQTGYHKKRHYHRNQYQNNYYNNYDEEYYAKFPEIEVTIETEIPTIKEEDLLTLPSQEEYRNRMKDCDDQIQNLRAKITSINDEKRSKVFSNKQSNEGKSIEVEGKNFKQLLTEKNKIRDEKRELDEHVEKLNQKMTSINDDLRKLNKFVDKSLHTVEDVDKELGKLEYKLTTESIPVAQQKELYKKQKFLEKSKQYYSTFESLQQKYGVIKTEHYETKGKSFELGKQIKEYNEVLDKMNIEFKSKQSNKEELKESLNKLESKVQEIKAEIGKLFEKKNEIREQYYKSQDEYYTQLDTIAYYQYLQEQKDYLIYLDNERKQREAEELKEKQRKEAEEKKKEEEKLERKKNMPNPFEEDIKTCGYLITQLRLKKRDYEALSVKAEADIKRRQEDVERKKEIEKKQEEGKILIFEKENDVVVGKRNKKKQKQKENKQKVEKPVVAEEEKINTAPAHQKSKIELKYDVVKGILELNLDPPSTIEEVEKVIDQIYEMKVKLEEKGRQEIERIFTSENWKEAEEKYLKEANDILLVEEEENNNNDRQNKKTKAAPKPYKLDDEEPTLGGTDHDEVQE